jgi:predicted permease
MQRKSKYLWAALAASLCLIMALLVMLGSIATPSCYVMAKQMGHEGVLTGSVCVTTTLFSAFSLTFWLFLLRSMGCIA